MSDADRFRDDRRREALAMIALWSRSRKPWAADDLRYWRGVRRDVQRKIRRLGEEPDTGPSE